MDFAIDFRCPRHLFYEGDELGNYATNASIFDIATISNKQSHIQKHLSVCYRHARFTRWPASYSLTSSIRAF